MKHLALIILAFGTLALRAQSTEVAGGNDLGGDVDLSQTTTVDGGMDISQTTTVDGGLEAVTPLPAPAPYCPPAPIVRGPVMGGRVVVGTALVARGGVCAPTPVVVRHTRIMPGGCYPTPTRVVRRRAPVACAVPTRRCGDMGFYYGQRTCR